MQQEFNNHPNLRFLIGDVRDAERLSRACEGVDFIIHAAALKQVPACEFNPMEAVATNVNGAINVINAALNNNVPRVIALSTDKAVSPANIYGATKLCSDRLFIQSNAYRGTQRDTRFSVVRYGNVMASRGSVIPVFEKQREKGVVTITDAHMTRFWITLNQAVDFVLSSYVIMEGGELFVPKIPSMKISDLAAVIAPKAKQKIIGIRPGEKLHESLLTSEESRLAYDLPDRYVVLSPSASAWGGDTSWYRNGTKVAEGFTYDSGTNKEFLTPAAMRALLKKIAAEYTKKV
jgi:UDP-N-acetylglucosamine 4,6-dehydratase